MPPDDPKLPRDEIAATVILPLSMLRAVAESGPDSPLSAPLSTPASAPAPGQDTAPTIQVSDSPSDFVQDFDHDGPAVAPDEPFRLGDPTDDDGSHDSDEGVPAVTPDDDPASAAVGLGDANGTGPAAPGGPAPGGAFHGGAGRSGHGGSGPLDRDEADALDRLDLPAELLRAEAAADQLMSSAPAADSSNSLLRDSGPASGPLLGDGDTVRNDDGSGPPTTSGASEFSPGAIIGGRYEVVKLLGTGGFGAVYQSLDARLGVQVAVKVVTDLTQPVHIERFNREIAVAASLSHPNIVALLDSGVDRNGMPYMVSELAEGGSLEAWVGRRGPMTPFDATRVVCGVLRALVHAHERNIIHRDIKPSNILLCGGDGAELTPETVKLIDFGIARRQYEASTITQAGQVLGSALYMSPEQAKEEQLTGHTDIYSLGCTFFFLLTGAPPYTGGTALHLIVRHMMDPVPDIREKVPAIPERLANVLGNMLAKVPEERYSAAEHLLWIEEILADEFGSNQLAGQIEQLVEVQSPRLLDGSGAMRRDCVLPAAEAELELGRKLRKYRSGAAAEALPPVIRARINNHLAITLYSLGKMLDARRYLRDALAALPADADPKLRAAVLYNLFCAGLPTPLDAERLDKVRPDEKAVQAYREAVALDPSLAEFDPAFELVRVHDGWRRAPLYEVRETGGSPLDERGFLLRMLPAPDEGSAAEVAGQVAAEVPAPAGDPVRIRHHGIVPVYEFVRPEPGRRRYPYLLMEHVAAPDLETGFKRVTAESGRPPNPTRAVRRLRNLFAALHHLHRCEPPVCVGTLDPQKAFLTGGGVKLTHLGLPPQSGPVSAQALDPAGESERFYAPEVRRGDPPVPASDVYALAKTLRFLLTGTVEGPVGEGPARLDPEFAAVLERATADDPARRQQSIAELVADIERSQTAAPAQVELAEIRGGRPVQTRVIEPSDKPFRVGRSHDMDFKLADVQISRKAPAFELRVQPGGTQILAFGDPNPLDLERTDEAGTRAPVPLKVRVWELLAPGVYRLSVGQTALELRVPGQAPAAGVLASDTHMRRSVVGGDDDDWPLRDAAAGADTFNTATGIKPLPDPAASDPMDSDTLTDGGGTIAGMLFNDRR